MKSLLGIQQDVRNLVNILTDVQGKIKDIEYDINELRTTNQKIDLDYSKIEILSRQLTIGKHPLGKLEDDKIKKTYVEMLLSILRFDTNEEVMLNRLILIQRIQLDSGIDLALEDLYKNSCKMHLDTFNKIVDLIPVNYIDTFVVDVLLVAYLGGVANAEVSEYIVGMFSLFGVDKERIKILSLVARVALSQDTKRMKIREMYDIVKCIKVFKHYMKPDVLEDLFISLRKVIVEFSDYEVIDFKWRVKQEEKIEKGKIIATYNSVIDLYETVEVTASDTGTIYLFRDNSVYYGVISHENDNKDSIKRWVKTRRNKV